MSVWHPRNDHVLVRVEKKDPGDGIALPDTSIEGKRFVVVAVGPDVENLEPGDDVMMCGNLNKDYWEVPGEKNLLIIKQENVLLVKGE